MTDKPTFLSEVLAGRATRSDADDWIAAWHESDTDLELHEFLGFTWPEYQSWNTKASNLDEILGNHGWRTPDVADTKLFRITHDVAATTQIERLQNATMTTVDDMAISISVTAPSGLDYRQAKVVNDLLRASMRRLVDVGCIVDILIGVDQDVHDEEKAVSAILELRGDGRGNGVDDRD